MRGRGARRLVFAVCAAALLASSTAAALASLRTITRSSAQTVAQELNLRPSDLPGLTAHSNPLTALQRRDLAEAAACEALPAPSEAFAIVPSDMFSNGPGAPTESVSSQATIWPSDSAVNRYFAGAKQHRGRACVLRLLLSTLSSRLPKGYTVTATSEPVAPHLSGTDHAVGGILIVTLHGKSATVASVPHATAATVLVNIYLDTIAFAYGQAEVTIAVETMQAPASSAVARLAALLVARAHAVIG